MCPFWGYFHNKWLLYKILLVEESNSVKKLKKEWASLKIGYRINCSTYNRQFKSHFSGYAFIKVKQSQFIKHKSKAYLICQNLSVNSLSVFEMYLTE